MISCKGFLILVCYVLVVYSLEFDGDSASPKLLYTIIPLKPDSWWKMYVNNSSNHGGIPYNNAVKLKLNDSFLRLGTVVEGGDSGSVFSWERDLKLSKNVFLAQNTTNIEEIRMATKERSMEISGNSVDVPELNLASRIVSLFPPFVPSTSSRVKNEQCIKDSRYYLEELNNFALWALKMYDSSAKLPSGLLNGNVNQYGDIDQCLNVRSPLQDEVVKGRYCLTTTALRLSDPNQTTLQQVHKLLMSHGMFVSNLDDPGHRLPRFSSIHWALCVPASCEARDVQLALSDILHNFTEGTGITFQVHVTPEMCQVKQEQLNLPIATLFVGGMFILIIIIAIIATVFDPAWKMVELKLSTREKLVQAFSIRKNALALFSLSRSSDDIESVHGIRALNAVLLLIAHKCMALFFNPYLNRTTMAEALGQSWTGFARGACLYTEPFILMSGLLTSYSFYKELESRKKLNIAREYISRLMRIVPNLVTLILFCTFILPWTGTGPLWNQVVRHHSDLCKQTWWRNLLFVHNYFGFKDMCLTHTHHLGIDTQLFLFSPLLVYLVWKWPRAGFSTLAGVAAISTALRYNVTYSKKLSHFIVFGSSVRQLFKTADLSYTLPAHRATVYVMGIALGFFLRYCGRGFKLKKMYLTLGWMAAMACFYFALINPAHMASRHYVYDVTEAANFAAFAPICFSLFISWIIFVSYIGHGGLLSQILSWRGFLVTTRLSYALYLLQFPIFFYTVGTNRVSQTYSVLLLLDVPELVIIIIGCISLTLFIDLPFQNIRSILLKKPK